MSIGDLATILTVAGVTIYVLGLIGLAIPIRRIFTGDVSTAWYAVSLVPKTVVADQGVRIWLRWPIAVAVPLLVMTAVARSFMFSLPFKSSPYLTIRVVTIVSCASLAIVFGRHYARFLLRLPRQVPTPSLFRFLLIAVGLLVPALAGVALILISIAMLTNPEFYDWLHWALPVFYRTGSAPLIVKGILVLLTGSFFFGLPFAIWASPRLPSVQITSEGVRAPLVGWLVGHSDGFWHLFADANEDHQEHRDVTSVKRYDLISIYDEKTLLVRTLGKEAAPTGAAPETHRRRARRRLARRRGQGRKVGVTPPEHPAPE